MSTRSDDAIEPRLEALAETVVAEAGLELVELDVRGKTGSRVVRVIVDSDDGVSLDTCAQISRELSEALDADDFIPGRYTLEVTSPGVDRPLRSARDFTRNIGRDVRIWRTREAIDAGAKGEADGALLGVEGDVLTLEVDGDTHHVPLAEIDRGKVLLPW